MASPRTSNLETTPANVPFNNNSFRAGFDGPHVSTILRQDVYPSSVTESAPAVLGSSANINALHTPLLRNNLVRAQTIPFDTQQRNTYDARNMTASYRLCSICSSSNVNEWLHDPAAPKPPGVVVVTHIAAGPTLEEMMSRDVYRIPPVNTGRLAGSF